MTLHTHNVSLLGRNMALWVIAMRVQIIAMSLMLSGCATITRRTTEMLPFSSEPSGAAVHTTIGLHCPATPCQMEVSRKTEFTATFTKEGYKPTSILVQTGISGTGGAGLAGNIIFGGVIGVVTDASTGATMDHYPNPVHATMQPVDPTPEVVKPGPRARPPKPTGNSPLTMRVKARKHQCMSLRHQLIRTSDAYATARGLSEGRVATIVFADGKALARIKSGGDITTGTFERAMAWFSTNWPEGAEWPADVPRPPASPEPSEDAA